MTGQEKEARERSIFERFVRAAGLFTASTQIESRCMPEPDILFRSSSGAPRAFELVEILDQGYSSSLHRASDTKQLCEDFFDRLLSSEKDQFVAKFSNADIFLNFGDGVTKLKRKNTLPRIFRKLSALPASVEGEVLVRDPEFKDVLSYVYIQRGGFNGPVFDTNAFIRTGDPTISAIEGKLLKNYLTPYSLELLVYIDGNPMFPDEIWLGKLREFFDMLDHDSVQFSSIFVFDLRSDSVRYSWDRRSNPSFST